MKERGFYGKVIIGISGNEQEFPTKSGRTYVTVASELADGVVRLVVYRWLFLWEP